MKSTLQLAAMAAKWWEPPRDALDTMVLNACNKDALAPYKHLDFIPFDPTLKVRRRQLCLPSSQHQSESSIYSAYDAL